MINFDKIGCTQRCEREDHNRSDEGFVQHV